MTLKILTSNGFSQRLSQVVARVVELSNKSYLDLLV